MRTKVIQKLTNKFNTTMKKTLFLILFTTIFYGFSQTTHTINAGSYYYSPSELTIDEGDIVVWVNDGGFHDVNGAVNSITGEPFNNPESFDSPSTNVAGDEIYTHTFNTPGTYIYDCSVGSHAENGMVGIIIVNPSNPTTVVDIIVGSDSHNTLEAAVIAAELADDLSGDGPFTVFAPTDAAFEALPEGLIDELLLDPTGELANILLHHVASGSVLSTDLSDGMMVNTLFGTELTVSISDMGVMIDNAMVTLADLTADNGVVHVIDAVLVPEDGCENNDSLIAESFSTLSTCDQAIDYLVTNYGYSEYDACQWDGNMGNGPLFGGMIMSEFCECSCEGVEQPVTTVVDIIVGSDSHNTLEAAVIAAELADDLSGDGPFTVFAPTDAAFEALPEGLIDELLLDPTGELANILLHHVASGSVLSTDLSDGMMVNTLFGTELTVSISDMGVMIDNAMVTLADLTADNGVVHVIDAVLVPEENSDILEEFIDDQYMYSIDLLGSKVKSTSKRGYVFDVYKSGRVIKKYNFN